MSSDDVVLGCLQTQAVADLADVNRSTLDYWIRTKLVEPSLRPGRGHRRVRLWSVQDAVLVRTVANLRRAGCSLQRIRRAKRQITRVWASFDSSTTLVWTGHDVFRIGPEGRAESILRSPLQQAFRLIVSLPVGSWREEATAKRQFIRADRLMVGVPAETEEAARNAS